MTDLERLDAALARYLRPETFPIAVRLLKAGEKSERFDAVVTGGPSAPCGT